MGRVIAGMTISLDGFAACAACDVRRLYPDVAEMAAASSSMAATIAATGSVVVDQWTFDMGDADAYVGQYEFQVPILVVTNRPPVRQLKQDEYLTLTFVSDGVGQAIGQIVSDTRGFVSRFDDVGLRIDDVTLVSIENRDWDRSHPRQRAPASARPLSPRPLHR